MVPYVTETGSRGERTVDICPRLLNDGIIFLGPPVDYQVANAVMALLLHLRRKKSSFRSRRGA